MLKLNKQWLCYSALLTITLSSAQAQEVKPELTDGTLIKAVATPPPAQPLPTRALPNNTLVAAMTQPQATKSHSSIFGISSALVTADLQQRLQNDPPPVSLRSGSVELNKVAEILEFYRRRAYQPGWLNDANKPSQLAEQLLTVIDQAEQEGLRTSFYNARNLRNELRSLKIAFAPTPRQIADFDLLLTDTYLSYADHLVSGRIQATQVEEYWKLEPRSLDIVSSLQHALVRRDIDSSLAELISPHPGYKRLRKALSDYRELAAQGGWNTIRDGSKLVIGDRSERVRQLRQRLQATEAEFLAPLPVATTKLAAETTGTDTAETTGGSDTSPLTLFNDDLFDSSLEQAVIAFQERHGLNPDGVVGPNTLSALNVPVSQRIREIEVNLERLRWLPASLGERYIEVNVPAYKLQVIENGKSVLDARVIVGRDERQTPIFTGDMSYLVFSPYWYVPRTIMVEDKLPILRKNPYALRKQGIRIFKGSREINPGKVNWWRVNENNFNYSMRQDPGKRNALGGVKFMFPNKHSVYIHDTSSPNLFERSQRAFSSGCVRIDKPVELAEYLLRDTRWDRNDIVKATSRKREKRVELSENIPVHILYWTAWVDDAGKVQFRDDIYQRDTQLAKLLYSN